MLFPLHPFFKNVIFVHELIHKFFLMYEFMCNFVHKLVKDFFAQICTSFFAWKISSFLNGLQVLYILSRFSLKNLSFENVSFHIF